MTFSIYLMGIVDDIKTVCGVFGFLFGIGFLISVFVVFVFHRDVIERPDNVSCKADYMIAKKARNYLLLFVPLLFIGVFLPSSKTIAAMYLIPKIANNESVQQIPSKALEVMNKSLDAWIKDLTKEEAKK